MTNPEDIITSEQNTKLSKTLQADDHAQDIHEVTVGTTDFLHKMKQKDFA
jgi:hypothetical protein